jgi:predicted DCC family thiol-disulfide oxidoreductase YuxK
MTGNEDNPSTLRVFYDGACPLCTAEIGVYKSCAGAEAIDFVDVSQSSRDEIVPGLSRRQALARFHVAMPDGTIASGGRAFAELWAALPAFAGAGRLGRHRAISWLLEGAYRVFLPLRPALQRLVRKRG